jgi:NodT family efflux transporter outer membrane factor (OMF) lipoprotein
MGEYKIQSGFWGKRNRLVMMLPLNLTLLAVLFFVGCATLGPDYAAPELNLPEKFNSVEKTQSLSESDIKALSKWWEKLNDPALSGLIEKAIKGNTNLKEAGARIREARARRGVSNSSFFPKIDANATYTRSKSSENLGRSETLDLYSTGFDSGWELDIFGGVRRSVQAAKADEDAAISSYNNVMASLIAEVALNYVELRVFQSRQKLAKENIDAQSEIYDLTKTKHQAGMVSDVDLNQAYGSLENLRSQIFALNSSIEQTKNRIATLMGEYPGTNDNELSKPGPIPDVALEIAVGIPAEVLLQRPDVRMAERNLAAGTARIGAAKAELYPKIALSGSIGLEALSLNDLFSHESRTQKLGPFVSWRIFDAGALRKSVKAQEAMADQALFKYHSTVLTAIEEVESALTAFAKEQERFYSLTKAEQAARDSFDLTFKSYQAGLADFNAVLESQRSLLTIEDQAVQSKGAIAGDLIRLYKALGGGWQ